MGLNISKCLLVQSSVACVLTVAELHASRIAQQSFTVTIGLMDTLGLGNFKVYCGSFDADAMAEITNSGQAR
jgi:hypothetical protein